MLCKRTLLQVKILCFNFVLLGIILNSCVVQRKTTILQSKGHQTKEFTYPSFQEYTLKPYDELYIQIFSLDDEQTNITTNSGNMSATAGPYGASLSAQKIDRDGYLELPVVGKILVKDKTVEQVNSILKESFKNVLNMPMISVKLVNCYISVLGEVRNPGHFVYMEDKLNILDAISMAGDITDYGNRKTIILLRNNNGNIIRTELDLTKSEIVTSDAFYIKPYDVIYVKPMPRKFWGLREFPFALIFSTITTGLLVYSVMK